MNSLSFNDLPVEMQSMVFSHLPQTSRLLAERVCSSWREVLISGSLPNYAPETKMALENLKKLKNTGVLKRKEELKPVFCYGYDIILNEQTGALVETSIKQTDKNDWHPLPGIERNPETCKFFTRFDIWGDKKSLFKEAHGLILPKKPTSTVEIVAREMLIILNYSANLSWKKYFDKCQSKNIKLELRYRGLRSRWDERIKLFPYPFDKLAINKIRDKRLLEARLIEAARTARTAVLPDTLLFNS